MDWSELQSNYKELFEKYPISEMIFAYAYMYPKTESSLWYILRILACWIRGKRNRISNNDFCAEVVVEINNTRTNGWGLLWPFAEELEKREIPYYVFLSNQDFSKYEPELSELRYGKVVRYSERYSKHKVKNKFGDLFKIFLEWKKIKKAAKETRILNFWFYMHFYYTQLSIANGLYAEYLHHCRHIFSCGSYLYGMLYHKMGIRHYMYQHGCYADSTVKRIPVSLPGSETLMLCWGERDKRIIERLQGAKCLVIGNTYYAAHPVIPNENSKNIIFFSSSHDLGEERMPMVYKTMDMLLELSNKLQGKYQIKVKLHPNEKEEIYVNYNSAFGSVIEIVPGNVHSLEVLKDCMAALSWGETCGLEAAMSGIFSGQIMVLEDRNLYEFSYPIYNAEELCSLLETGRLIEITKQEQKITESYVESHSDVASYAFSKLLDKGILDEAMG